MDPVGGQRGWHGEGEIYSDVAVSNETPATWSHAEKILWTTTVTLLKNGCTYYGENSFLAIKRQGRSTLEWMANSGPSALTIRIHSCPSPLLHC